MAVDQQDDNAVDDSTHISLLDPLAVRHLVVHCSASNDDEDMSARDIHVMHLGFGWHGIGYHKVIRRSGLVEQGRPEFWSGAHVKGHNQHSLGVCMIGCDQFTRAQFAALESVLRHWLLRYPAAGICGHCDFSYTDKTCPNFDVTSWCRERGIHCNSVAVP